MATFSVSSLRSPVHSDDFDPTADAGPTAEEWELLSAFLADQERDHFDEPPQSDVGHDFDPAELSDDRNGAFGTGGAAW